MKVEAKSSSSGSCGKFIEVVIMLILIESYYCFIHGYYCSTTVNTASSKLMLLGITYYCWKPTRKVTQIPQPSDPMEHVADEAVHKELGGSLVRAATTAFSLGAEQDCGNIAKTQSKVTPNESSSQGTDSGGGPRCQETMKDTTAQTRVLELEKTKTSQHNKIASLKRMVKKLEKRNMSRTHKLKRLYKVGLTARVESSDDEKSLGEDASKQEKIEAIDADEDITLFNDQDDVDKDMFDVNVLGVKINAHYQLAERLQAQEQEEFSDAEKATLFQQLLEKRRKYFAAKRAEEKRNKSPTQAQQRKIICTYLKSMEGYKLNNLKLKEFDSIKEMFDKAFRRVNTFVDYRTELVKGKEKRAGKELIQKKEVAIDAIPLDIKSPRIVDRMIHKEGKKSYYQIIRADGKYQMYMFFSQMFKSFDREDLEDLYKLIYMLVEKKHPLTPPTLSMMLEKKLQIDYESEMAQLKK
nr:hypothetical protein [Tanacetum cinerariifolium]